MFFINCVYLLKYLLNIYYKIFKLKLSIIFIHICLNFFEIYFILYKLCKNNKLSKLFYNPVSFKFNKF